MRSFRGWFLDGGAVCRSVTRMKGYEDELGGQVIFGHSSEQWDTLKIGADAYV
jgi:hypothetical protein